MKPLFLIIIFIAIGFSTFSQDTTTTPVYGTREYYHQKSVRQHRSATVLLITGGVLMGTGYLIGNSKEASFEQAGTGALIGALGFISTVTSIFKYAASSHNKHRAEKATTSLSMQTSYARFVTGQRSFPAIAYRIRL